MKKFLKRLLITAIIAFTVIGGGAIPVVAGTYTAPQVKNDYIGVKPFADVLQTHFRWLNGVLQYRIWNATRGRWENEWTNVL